VGAPELDKLPQRDPTLIATAYKKQRLYLFTRREPADAEDATVGAGLLPCGGNALHVCGGASAGFLTYSAIKSGLRTIDTWSVKSVFGGGGPMHCVHVLALMLMPLSCQLNAPLGAACSDTAAAVAAARFAAFAAAQPASACTDGS
jgi:hypothetical protein